mmetsp:Transcript_36900/g.39980  ORF Transcript_36900/g.39980 Transcript_36900/m.39980 type:complete len:80 (+) Transcript_36900:466-705(+)
MPLRQRCGKTGTDGGAAARQCADCLWRNTPTTLSLSLSLSLVTAVWVIGVSLSLSAWPASERGGTEFVSHTEEAGRQVG